MSENREFYHYDHRQQTKHPIVLEDPFHLATQQWPPEFSKTADPRRTYLDFQEYSHVSVDYEGQLLGKGFHLSSGSFDSAIIDEGKVTNEIFPADGATGTGFVVNGGDCSTTAAVRGVGGSGSGTPAPLDSPISSSVNEAAVEDDRGRMIKQEGQWQGKECEDGDERSKKVCKAKKKGEKRQREPRFAFVTKSEVDHLEDGYRWRKYGQKAVKNSPYARSYYRCTTQKCPVKKRVERSCKDPSTVVTTYEGQHIHHSPTNLHLNGNVLPSPMHTLGFHPAMYVHPKDHLLIPPLQNALVDANHGLFPQDPAAGQLFPADGYGLLQEIIPPFIQPNQP